LGLERRHEIASRGDKLAQERRVTSRAVDRRRP
jgi:hypothetical protein